MRELFLDSVSFSDAEGRARRCEYYILIGQDSWGREDYGLRVREGDRECAIPGITMSAARMEELADLVIAGVVTPTTLADVVSDWL